MKSECKDPHQQMYAKSGYNQQRQYGNQGGYQQHNEQSYHQRTYNEPDSYSEANLK
jgi:hypothetical protein